MPERKYIKLLGKKDRYLINKNTSMTKKNNKKIKELIK